MLSNEIILNTGSFRDPDGKVFYYNNDIYRTVDINYLSTLQQIIKSDFFNTFIQTNNIIETKLIKNDIYTSDDCANFILKHEKILFVSYPYEWSFYMLKDAALLSLNILKNALLDNFILKDGTAWNVTFYKGKMCFFDVISIDKYQDGQIWNGYTQFCQEFLYPLLIKSYKNIDFQQFFKGSLVGITVDVANAFFGLKDWFKKGILKHIVINSRLIKSKTFEQTSLKNKFYLDRKFIVKLVLDLESIIQSLYPLQKHSLWSDYVINNTYSDKDNRDKKEFIVNSIAIFKNFNNIIDLGCNTGEYSLMIANINKNLTVFACDLDSNCIDFLYLKLKKIGCKNIYPFVLDLMNPSTECGWDLRERSSIWQRITADAFLSLALIHHVCIAYNVPLENFIRFLSSIASQGVLEWIDKKDPMVQFLLRNRKDIFYDYTWEHFVNVVSKYFILSEVKIINNGNRKLCLLLSK